MSPKLQAHLRRERSIKLISVLLLVGTSLMIVVSVDNMLLSFVLAFVATYLLTPLVDLLERKGVPRQTAILIPFLASGAIIAFGIYEILPLLTSQATSLATRCPKYQTDLATLVANTEDRFKVFFKIYDVRFANAFNTWILTKTAAWSTVIPGILTGSVTVLLLTPIFAFFMLQDGRSISRRLLGMVPNNLFEAALNIHHQLNDQMGGFVRARFIEAAIVGVLVWLGLQGAGFPYASLLGLFAGITNLIPYLGPVIGAVPALLIALLSPDAMMTQSMTWNLVIVTSVYFFAQLVDVVFVIPLVVARIVNLHPVTVIVVIIVGSELKGILGMVISIPVASAGKLIFRALYDHLIDFRS